GILTLDLDHRHIPAQGYRIEIATSCIQLTGGDEAGLFYALQTLRQLITAAGLVLPEMVIEDHPDFAERGVMLDISRCKVPTMEALSSYVDLFASLKYNQLQLYTEHTFAFAAHEAVWYDASPMTAEQVLALDEYCRRRYIQLVPNFNSFGHAARWVREYPDLANCPHGAICPWGNYRTTEGNSFKPNAASLRFLDSLYAEFLPNFQSRMFNVGCDETWELGQGWSKPLCDKKGVTGVYVDFLKGIDRLVQKHGRKTMFWGDIILREPEFIRNLPEDIIALNWGYEANHPFDKEGANFSRSGVPFYVCPGTSSWNSLVGRTNNCIANLKSAATNGALHGAAGYLVTDWGDGGHHQYQPFSYPGYLAGACYSWCAATNLDSDIVAGMNQVMFADRGGATGRLAWELGNVHELTGVLRSNSSTLNGFLFWNMADKPPYPEAKTANLRKAVARLNELEQSLVDCRPMASDGPIVVKELANGLAMARHGLRRILASRGKTVNLRPLRHELQHIISQHETLWMARNRHGGLHDSSERLRTALKPLL
ncbi:MAG: family 20 glycosylhydrolase, partial [bacterium]